ncbi:MAG TPA: FAD:protein FMN transferase [Planctomycetota bacterium]
MPRASLLLLGLLACACAGPLERVERARPAMGTEFRVVVYAGDRARAEAAAEAALARVQDLDRCLSDYDDASELARLGAASDAGAPTGWIALSDDLARVLEAAQRLARASGGAFDVTAGPYTHLWRRARRQGELPDPARLAAAAGAVGHARLELDPERRRARLGAARMRLDLGGIGKGFALDEAFAVLARHGLERALVVGGGELRAGAPPPGERGWRVRLVGLDGASEALLLAHAALATSGDLEQALELDGRRHSHVLDPRTGLALTERRLVSVVGPSATLTDGLATALSVLGPGAGPELLVRHPGYAARLQVERGEGMEERRTPGFPAPLSCGEAPEPPRASEPRTPAPHER